MIFPASLLPWVRSNSRSSRLIWTGKAQWGILLHTVWMMTLWQQHLPALSKVKVKVIKTDLNGLLRYKVWTMTLWRQLQKLGCWTWGHRPAGVHMPTTHPGSVTHRCIKIDDFWRAPFSGEHKLTALYSTDLHHLFFSYARLALSLSEVTQAKKKKKKSSKKQTFSAPPPPPQKKT